MGRAKLSPIAPFLVLLLAIAVVYGPELTFRKAFFYFDISSLNLPARAWGFRQIREGYFPQWCPHWGTGFPFVAESQSGICYPPNYLFYPWLRCWKAYALLYLGHLLLAGSGAYLLFRRWASVNGSLLGALMFALGGRLLAHQIHTAIAEALAWFPLVLFFLDRFARQGRKRDLLAATIAAGMQLLAGAFQAVLCCQTGYLIFVVAHLWISPSRWTRLLGGYTLMSLLAAGLGAILLLPTVELFGYSLRAEGLSRQWSSWGTWTPQLWVTAFVPYLYGHLGYGNAWLQGPTPWCEVGLYHGILALPLAAVGLLSHRRLGVWLMAVLVVGGLILASGPASSRQGPSGSAAHLWQCPHSSSLFDPDWLRSVWSSGPGL